MKKKKIGNFEVSDILLGSDLYGTEVDENTAFSLIDRYLEFGGNCVDTARLYGFGKSEETIGKWVKSARKQGKEIYISTKGGHPRLETMNVSRISEEEIENDINDSLKALCVDAIDFYWLHRDDISKSPEEILEFMNKFIKQGKIKNFGVSNWRAERIIKANDYAINNGLAPIVASQLQWSLAVQSEGIGDPTLVRMDNSEFELYKKSGLTAVAYSSQGKGIFSMLDAGGVDAVVGWAKSDYLNDTNLKRFKVAKEIATKYNVPISSIVLAYIYSNPFVSSHVLIGPMTIDQLEDSLSNSALVLTKDEMELLSK